MDRLEEGFEETFGVRLVEDLLAHWGSEVVVLGSIAPPGPGARPDEMFADLALAFELADAGAVETSLERMLRSRGLHVIGESRDFRGIEVHTLPFFGVFEVHYTFGNDALAVGFGRDPDVFPRLLDRLAARDRGEEPGPFPDPVADRLERMPEDWRNMRVLDVRRLADNVFRGMEARVRGRSPGGPGPAAGTIGSSRDTVRSLLERYDLDVLVWTTTFTDDALKVHAVW